MHPALGRRTHCTNVIDLYTRNEKHVHGHVASHCAGGACAFPEQRHVDDLRPGSRSPNPWQHRKLRRDLTARPVSFRLGVFTINIHFFTLPVGSKLVLLSSHISNALGPWRLRPSPLSLPPGPVREPSLSSAALARQSELLQPIDDAGCAGDTTEQRRIIPCSQISEPRLRFRPRGRR